MDENALRRDAIASTWEAWASLGQGKDGTEIPNRRFAACHWAAERPLLNGNRSEQSPRPARDARFPYAARGGGCQGRLPVAATC